MDSRQFLSKAKSTFKDRLQNSGLDCYHLDSLDMDVYYPQTISLLRKDRIMKSMQQGGLEHMVDIILEIARDEEGTPLFKQGNRKLDKKTFMNDVDPDLVFELAGVLSSALNADVEEGEAEKNSEKTDP